MRGRGGSRGGGEDQSSYLVGMGPVHMLGAVRGIGEGLATPLMFTHVWTLACVRAKMGFEVLQT